MTSRRKTKKETAKLMAKLLALRTNCKVRHYSRAAKMYKEWLKKISSNPWLAFQRYYEELPRDLSTASFLNRLIIPELKYSRERVISGTGYGWQNSEGKKPLACCLGISPFLLYVEPTLSSLADDGLSHSSAGIPLEPKKAFDLTDQFIKIIKKQTEDDQ